MLAVVPASMAANSYNLLLFSSLDLSSLFFSTTLSTFPPTLPPPLSLPLPPSPPPPPASPLRIYLQRINLLLFRQLFPSPPPPHTSIPFYYLWPSGLMVHVAFVHAGACFLFAFAFSLSLSLFSRVPLTHASVPVSSPASTLPPFRLHRYFATTSHAYL